MLAVTTYRYILSSVELYKQHRTQKSIDLLVVDKNTMVTMITRSFITGN